MRADRRRRPVRWSGKKKTRAIVCLSVGTRGGNRCEQKGADASRTAGRSGTTQRNPPPPHPAKPPPPPPPPSSQSNKTMAPRRLIKWLMEGMRALPSASPSPTPQSPRPPTTYAEPWILPPRRFSPASPIWIASERRRINAYLGSGSETPAQSNSCRGVIESPIISLTIIPSQLSPHLRIRADRCGGTAARTL